MLIFISHRGESKTPKTTKMEISVSTINDSQPLTIVRKNSVLDATGVLSPSQRFHQKHPPEELSKKAVLKNFTNIHRKAPVLESLFSKVESLRSATLLRTDSNTVVFL